MGLLSVGFQNKSESEIPGAENSFAVLIIIFIEVRRYLLIQQKYLSWGFLLSKNVWKKNNNFVESIALI